MVLGGVALCGIHMGITQGLMATMVADTAPADLRGAAYCVVALAGLAWQVTRAGGGVDAKHHPGGARDCVDNIAYVCLISPARK